MKTPWRVVIGDVHFSQSTLDCAKNSLRQAVMKAFELKIPLLINGDLNNDKAILRGEVLNTIIGCLNEAALLGVEVIINIGNHDRLSEKHPSHSLNCLRPYAKVIDEVDLDLGIIPYCSTNEEFLQSVQKFDTSKILCVHQGIVGAYLGDYAQDKSSVYPNLLSGRRIIASHYHRKQDIDLPEGGQWSFVGSPYSITHGESGDGPKGFCVLYIDGSLEQVSTNLRKHAKVQRTVDTVLDPIEDLNSNDLLWLQVSGTYTQLEALDKQKVGLAHLGHSNFKLDLVFSDTKLNIDHIKELNDYELLDDIIANYDLQIDIKDKLKKLWRERIQ